MSDKDDHGITEGIPLVQYAREQNGNYHRTSSADTRIVDIVNRQAWQALGREITGARVRVETGKASPILYYMVVNQMNPVLLGKYMGISSWRIRWHLQPFGFRCLSSSLLRQYSELFRISVQDLRRGLLRAAIYENDAGG